METRNCQNCKKDFTIDAEDFKFYEKIKVPPPTFCPECRFQRRLMFRNNRVFYRRECKLCKKSILSIYSVDKSFIVYCKECWLSDKWDPISYGHDFDFSRPFFEQFRELQLAVPRSNMYQTNFINSEFCNYGMDMKDCYLVFGGLNNERLYFGNQVFDVKDSLDIAFSNNVEFSYNLFECQRVNKLFYSKYSKDCVDSFYLSDCRNCINCFGCVGLVNKQYHVFNHPYSKEEYEKFVKENTGSYKKHLEILKKINELKSGLPNRFARIYKSFNSTGDDLNECKNTHDSFSSAQAENSKFLFFCKNGSNECYDVSFLGFNAEMVYENCHGFGGNNTAFGTRNFNNQDARYNEDCHECNNIFGCEGLRKKSYCILNKQYSKEEYENIVSKIIEHMKKTQEYGEFFPSELSPFAYNETIAQEYFPLDKDEVLNKNYKWKEGEVRNYNIDIKNTDIVDNIQDVNEEILNKVIECGHRGTCKEQCTEAFKILPEELKFYKRMNLPLPRFCPNCRHFRLIGQRNPLKLWDRICMCDKESHFHGKEKCMVDFKTTYSLNQPEIIYCEKCYQQEVY